MSAAARLTAVRKQKRLTQQALADALGLHVPQVKRYKSGRPCHRWQRSRRSPRFCA
ncbi:helix-turn-helix domain-containing protein [Massilia pseudoviolaceinigra]|uniref:helix-turn-helix domain-containing protein n=1 Tax=Massilia pseudoviolaceinigra TaxID=3057165 RepID=UPI0035B51F21